MIVKIGMIYLACAILGEDEMICAIREPIGNRHLNIGMHDYN